MHLKLPLFEKFVPPQCERACRGPYHNGGVTGEYHNEMANEGVHFRSELKQWYNFWEKKLNNISEEIQGASKTRKKVDGKPGFTLEDPPDGISEASNFADTDFFPNIRKLLILGATSPIGSTVAERATSGIRQLKTPHRSTMGDKRESDLNLLHPQRIPDIDIQTTTNIKHWHTKCCSDIYQKVSTKNV